MATGVGDVVGKVFESGGGTSSAVDLGARLSFYAGLFFFLVIVAVGVFLFVYFMSYKHRVVIFEKTAEGRRFKLDKAKKFTKNGVTKYKLLKSKALVQTEPNYESKYYYGKHEAVVLHKENNFYHFHIGYNVEGQELDVLPQEVTDFVVNEIQADNMEYAQEGFWAKHGSAVVQIGGMLMVGFIMLMVIKEMVVVGAEFQSTAQILNSAIKNSCVGGMPLPP